jgi:hypothetical protein
MTQVTIIGYQGKPILYANLDQRNLKLSFEYYGDGDQGDYEIIYTLAPQDFASIATKFGMDPGQEILTLMSQISERGLGEEFYDALKEKEIKSEFFSWYS